MTVASATSRIEYSTTSGLLTYAYPFKIYADTDLLVYKATTLLTLNTHYSVTGAGNANGGNVVLTTNPGAGVLLVLERVLPLTQGHDYVENDRFAAESHEELADRDRMIDQQLYQRDRKRPAFLPGSATQDWTFPDPVSYAADGVAKYIRMNAAHTALEAVSGAADVAGVLDDTIPSVAFAALPAVGTAGRLRRVTDDVSGVFIDDGTRWRPLNRKIASVLDHPDVKNDGTNAQATTNGIQAVLDRAERVTFEPGVYLIDQPLTLRSNHELIIPPGATLKATSHRTGAGGTWTDTGILKATTKSHLLIHGGGTITGDKAVNVNLRIFGIDLRDCLDCDIDGLTILDMPASASIGTLGGDGIYIDGADSARININGCSIRGCVRQGISIVEGERYRITNCHINDITGSNPGAGIDCEVDAAGPRILDVVIAGCIFEDCHQWILLSNTGGIRADMQVTITGNVFRSARGSTNVGGLGLNQPGWAVAGNVFYTQAGHAICARTDDGQPLNGVITGNKFYGIYDSDERACIQVTSGIGLAITGNQFANTYQGAIRLDSNTLSDAISTISIIGNAFHNCVFPGQSSGVIELVGNSGTNDITDVVITDNTIKDTRTGGDEANTGILLTNISTAEQATLSLYHNAIAGPAAAFAGPSGMLSTGEIRAASAALDFDLSAVTYQDLTITVPGALTSDFVIVAPPATGTAGVAFFGWVSATDTVTVRAFTVTGTPNPASGTFSVMVVSRLP